MKKDPQMPSARRILGMVVGIVIIGLGIALFKQSHLGNDSISALNMRLAEMLGISLGVQNLCTNIYTPVPYFGCRVFTDALCALLCWLLGGLVGIGTLICAFCLGPFIQFFNGLVSERVLHYKPGGQ